MDPTRSPAKASIPKWKWNPTPPPAPPLLPPRRHAGRRSPESIAARSPSSSSNAGGEAGRRRGGSKVVSSIPLTGFHPGSYPMRSCASSLCGISRVAWRRHAVAGGALSQHHHHQQRHLVLRPPAPPPIGLALERFFSASSRRSAKRSAAAAKQSSQPPPPPSMDGGEPFYVVRKGDVIGIYKSLSDCQAQVSNSQPDGTGTSTLKRPLEMLSCLLEFDGASKGNPGKAGAGAVIRRLDGTVIAQLREGLGIATNNAAEYRALILGLTYAAKKGFKYIRAQGDSKLVCNQVSDVWRARHDTMADLCKRVKEIKGRFHTFQINHVLRLAKFKSRRTSYDLVIAIESNLCIAPTFIGVKLCGNILFPVDPDGQTQRLECGASFTKFTVSQHVC
uniref:RNase H type-1 domain-containing protein n=1 Tax=Oryza barthii TaxID=65489 RepID=A0A0D3GWX8_9ORYZ